MRMLNRNPKRLSAEVFSSAQKQPKQNASSQNREENGSSTLRNTSGGGGGGGDRGAGARENRGREGYGRREKKGREAGSLRWREAGEKFRKSSFFFVTAYFQSKKRTQQRFLTSI